MVGEIIWEHPNWTDAEKPQLPGSPASLAFPWPRRVAFGAIAILCSLTGSLGTGMIVANLPVIQGNLALTPAQGQWLLGAFVMTSCGSNLILFKFRMQFGIHLFVLLGLSAYAAVALLHLAVQSYETALIVRAASGFCATPLNSLGFLYMMEAAGKENAQRGLVVGLSLSQLATPLAYVFAPWLINLAEPGLQYAFEAGLALCALAAVAIFPLPFSERVKAFERKDAVTITLLASGFALLIAVLTEGRIQWWTDSPWIGLALCGAVVLIVGGMIFEYGRTTPLLDIRWLGTAEIVRFVLSALLLNLMAGEQSVGAVGFLRAVGMGPDQLSPLYLIVLLAMLAAVIVVGAFANPKTAVPLLVMVAAMMLAGAMLDRDITPLDRPHDFYLSQAIVGFASALFIGPLFLTGLAKVMKDGMKYALSLFVVFSIIQSIGLLLTTAVFNTFELFREHEYSGLINAGVDPTNPVVQQRLTMQGHVYDAVLTDPALRTAEGLSQLAQSATLNATTRAYNDIFLLIVVIAIAFIIWTIVNAATQARTARRGGAT